MKKSRLVYFIAFIIILIVEVIIALYVHDNFIRPYVGNILVIICIYYFAKFLFLDKIKNLSFNILIFSIIVEFIQYFQIINNLTINNHILRIILGATFDVKDIICYIVGYLIITIIEKYLINNSRLIKKEVINMFYEALPNELNKDWQEVLKIIPKETYGNARIGYSKNKIEYYLNNKTIKIPDRIYFNDIEVDVLSDLTDTQKEILYCFYTRSCNGYTREKYLRELFKIDFDYWAIPFILKLSDEYIVEILQIIYDNLKTRNNDDIKQFCLENKSIIARSYSRMVSYWNEYYRDKEPDFRKYIGRKLYLECFGYNRTFGR